jgi:hypothetical protein
MDKLLIIKNRIYNSSFKKSLNDFRDHVLEDIYVNLSLEESLTIPISKLIQIKTQYISSLSTKILRAYSLEYYTLRGWTINEAKQRIHILQKENSIKFANKRKKNPELYSHIKSPMNIDFWLGKGLTEEEAKEKIKSQRPVSHLYWINKGYSHHDAVRLAKEHQSNSGKISSRVMKANPEQYEGCNSTRIEYWLNKGYSLEESNSLLKDRQTTFSLEKCIKKYGEEAGTKIFNKRQTKWKKSLQENFEREGDGRSPSSKFANAIIKELCSYLSIEIPKKEKWIKCKETNKAYSYDFTYKKKIIEFNGDYWHCNPNLYEANFYNKNKMLTAKEIWQYDQLKNNLAKSHGYEVLVIWETEWIKDPKQCIEKCIKFLNKK